MRKELSLLEEMLRLALHSDVPLIEDICDHIRSTPGKRLRPNILFLASKSLGGSSEAPMIAGMAVELIHTATLIHDDIIDGHMLRRGEETVYARWGNNVATIMGDFLYSKAFASLGDAGLYEIMEILARTTNIMSVGEMMQFQQTKNIEMSEAGYMDMIYSKTASLFSASSECGAVIGSGGSPNGFRKPYASFGRNIGLAFQITDDLIDYLAIDEQVGKPTASDFSDGRVTLPFITAFRNAPATKKERMRELFHYGFDKDADWGEIISFVRGYGGVEYSYRRAQELGARAKASLDTITPSRERDALCMAADYVIGRVDPLSA
ncbi:MAG: polyprenyl synthetase family protein [Candidatus Krumholzibacteriota bacterium]|nr:polyprenyl synthetase family protein [Candidatus Krumholzibacteriota bacterium]